MMTGMGGGMLIPMSRMAIPRPPVESTVDIELPLVKAKVDLLHCSLLSLEISPAAAGDPDILSTVMGELISLVLKRQTEWVATQMKGAVAPPRLPSDIMSLITNNWPGSPPEPSTEGNTES